MTPWISNDDDLDALARTLEARQPSSERAEHVRTRVLAGAAVQRQLSRRSLAPFVMAGTALAAAAAVVVWLARDSTSARPAIAAVGTAEYERVHDWPDYVIRLDDGTIAVTVESLATTERFRVATADAELEVRGTSFEVAATHTQLASVVVRDGRVEIRLHDRAPIVLAAGQSWTAVTTARRDDDAKAGSATAGGANRATTAADRAMTRDGDTATTATDTQPTATGATGSTTGTRTTVTSAAGSTTTATRPTATGSTGTPTTATATRPTAIGRTGSATGTRRTATGASGSTTDHVATSSPPTTDTRSTAIGAAGSTTGARPTATGATASTTGTRTTVTTAAGSTTATRTAAGSTDHAAASPTATASTADRTIGATSGASPGPSAGAQQAAASTSRMTPGEAEFRAGWTALRANDVHRALPSFAAACAAAIHDALGEDACFWVGATARRAGDPSARAALERFISQFPSSARIAEASALLGWLLYDAGDLDGAERRFQVADHDRVPAVRDSAQRGLTAIARRRKP